MSSRQPFLNGYPSLSALLSGRLGKEALGRYRAALAQHYRSWRLHRTSDAATLAYLRQVLYRVGALTLNRNPEWRIDRSVDEIQAIYGPEVFQSVVQKAAAEQWTGEKNPAEMEKCADWGPGVGRAVYEFTRPHIVMWAMGIELLFSVEGTLRNALREEIRADAELRQWAPMSGHVATALAMLEGLSVAEFAVGDAPAMAEYRASIAGTFAAAEGVLKGEVVRSSALGELASRAQGILAAGRERIWNVGGKWGEPFRVAVMLGLLVDELVSRLYWANGMAFWYERLSELLAGIDRAWNDLLPDLAACGVDADALRANLARYRRECSDAPESVRKTGRCDADWLDAATKFADDCRRAGFRLRDQNREVGRLFFAISNGLWQWIFFLECERSGPTSRAAGKDRVGSVLRWLRRPWGVINLSDVEAVFRGQVPHDDGEVPLAFSVLTPFLCSEIEDYVPQVLGYSAPDAAVEAYQRFIGRRLLLADARRSVKTVEIDEPELQSHAALANVVISSFATWLYHPARAHEFEAIEGNIDQAMVDLRNGGWMREFASGDGKMLLSAAKRKMVDEYLRDPAGFVASSFTPAAIESSLDAFVDVFPPEEFLTTHAT